MLRPWTVTWDTFVQEQYTAPENAVLLLGSGLKEVPVVASTAAGTPGSC